MSSGTETSTYRQGLEAARLEGRISLVTGAAQGIGAGISRSLCQEGARVAVADIDGDQARSVARDLESGGAETLGLDADVRDEESLRGALQEVRDRWGDVEVMVNNAAINIGRPFEEVDGAEWDEVLDVNLRGVLFGCQLVADGMRRAGFGRIINISSDAGQQPNEFVGAHYAASKAGIIGLTKVVARSLAPYGVTVNVVAPAAIEGPIMSTLPQVQIDALREGIPVGRFGRSDEVGALVAFLASDRAGYITGATYDINGGQIMR